MSPDGTVAACRRQQAGAIRTLDYSDGPAYVHRLDGRTATPTASMEPARPDAPRAPDATLGVVYRAMLALPELTLTRQHREQLCARGLSGDDVARGSYRTLPAACRASIGRALRERFADDLLTTIPGLIVRDGPHGRYLTVGGRAGLLVPISNAAGAIIALVVRPDDPGEGGKYRWLSSRPTGGPGPGARVHVPAGVQPSKRVIVTEGALKAAVAFALSGRPIIGLPGPNVTDEALAVLRELQAVEVLLALDADAASNPHVARAQLDGLKRLKAAGFTEGLLRWDPSLGKGLDDALLAWRSAR